LKKLSENQIWTGP